MIEMISLLLNKGYIYAIKCFDKNIFVERGLEGIIYQHFPLFIRNYYIKSLSSFFQMKIKYI